MLIEKAKNQVIEERNGELSIKKCPAEYYDIVKYMYANEKDCLIISDRGEASYIGDVNYPSAKANGLVKAQGLYR